MPDILSVNILFLFENVSFSLTFEGHFHGMWNFHGMLALFSSLHSCLAYMVSDKSAVILILFLHSNLSFCLHSNLPFWFPSVTLYLLRCGFLFSYLCCLIFSELLVSGLLSVTNFESSRPLFLQIIIVPSSLFFLPSGVPITSMLFCLILPPSSWMLCSIFFLFCFFSFLFLLTWSINLIFMFTYSFLSVSVLLLSMVCFYCFFIEHFHLILYHS